MAENKYKEYEGKYPEAVAFLNQHFELNVDSAIKQLDKEIEELQK